ncbi:MAG: Holliday junction branch migration protein RuvA, partial [Bacilli bacterium]|nr:Holliday junction branch migration protein RuvA [Bacilli bacterium]
VMYGILIFEDVYKMFNYIKGKVESYGPNYISLENNGVGYMIYVPNPYVYQEGKDYKVFIYTHIREEEFTLYGFRNEQERDFFLRLINVKGVGPKLALPILASPVDAIYDAIERENILYLTKFPKVGDKVARQIILDLKGKLVRNDDLFTNDGLDELMAVLDSLGYKKGDVKKILPQVDASNPIEQQIKDALKLLMSR